MSEHESFDEWYLARHGHRFVADDDEVREWSLFVGHPVTPMEIAELKQRLRDMLRRENYEDRQKRMRGANDG